MGPVVATLVLLFLLRPVAAPGTVDIAMVGVTVSPWPATVGRPSKVIVVFENVGATRVPAVEVTLRMSSPNITERKVYAFPLTTTDVTQWGSVSFDWTPPSDAECEVNASVAVVNATEVNTGDNSWSGSFWPQYLSLTLEVPAGVTLSVGGVSRASQGTPIVIQRPWGVVRISSPSVVTSGQSRLVFLSWEGKGLTTTNPTLILNLTESVSFHSTYRSEYLCRFAFKDRENRELSLTFYLTAGGKSFPCEAGKAVWLPEGDAVLERAYYAGYNVLPNPVGYQVIVPMNFTNIVALEDLSFFVQDSFGVPEPGALVTVFYPNGSAVAVLTSSEGVATVTRAVIRQPLTVSVSGPLLSDGFSATVLPDEGVSSWIFTVGVSGQSVAIYAGIPLAVVAVLLLMLWESRRKKA